MRKIILIAILTLFGCTKSDDLNIKKNKLIQRIEYLGTHKVDLFYYNNKNQLTLIEKRNNYYPKIDAKIQYKYNSNDQLISITQVDQCPSCRNDFLYEYYPDGNLKTIKFDFQNRTDYVYHLEYENNVIIVNRNANHEYRIFLDANYKIIKTETRYQVDGDLFLKEEFKYNSGGNTESYMLKGGGSASNIKTYSYTYDDMNNPFSVKDFALPNNLSLKKIEELLIIEYTNNHPSMDPNFYFGYLGGNNILSIDVNDKGSFYHLKEFNYFYNRDNYPTAITIKDMKDNSLIPLNLFYY